MRVNNDELGKRITTGAAQYLYSNIINNLY